MKTILFLCFLAASSVARAQNAPAAADSHAGTGLGNRVGGPDYYGSSGVAYLF